MSWNHTCPRCKKQSPIGNLFCGLICAELFAKGGFCKKCKKKGTMFDKKTCSVIDFCEDHKDDAIKELVSNKVYGIHNSRRMNKMLDKCEQELTDVKESKKRYERDAKEFKEDAQAYKQLWKEEKEKRLKLEEQKQKEEEESTNKLINMLYTFKTLNSLNTTK